MATITKIITAVLLVALLAGATSAHEVSAWTTEMKDSVAKSVEMHSEKPIAGFGWDFVKTLVDSKKSEYKYTYFERFMDGNWIYVDANEKGDGVFTSYNLQTGEYCSNINGVKIYKLRDGWWSNGLFYFNAQGAVFDPTNATRKGMFHDLTPADKDLYGAYIKSAEGRIDMFDSQLRDYVKMKLTYDAEHNKNMPLNF